jgi:8-oxo-dGTP pyrophosphatase MutT (NUDIX family)
VANEKPRGASIVVWRMGRGGREYLVLHRSHVGGADFAGEWAWTPPAGARLPGEPLDVAARRELREEAGLDVPITPTNVGSEEWAIFVAEAPDDAAVTLDQEHDGFDWLPAEEAATRCLPSFVGESISRVAEWLDRDSGASA